MLKWNTYGGVEEEKILWVYSKNILTIASYKNYLRCKLYVDETEVKFRNLVEIKDKFYAIIEYAYDYLLGEIELGLIEIITNQLPYDELEEVALKSATSISKYADSYEGNISGRAAHCR